MDPTLRKGYAPPRLTRSTADAMAAGVLSGLGHFFGVDPTWLRIAYAVATIFTAIIPGIAVYAILALVIPGDAPANGPGPGLAGKARPRILAQALAIAADCSQGPVFGNCLSTAMNSGSARIGSRSGSVATSAALFQPCLRARRRASRARSV